MRLSAIHENKKDLNLSVKDGELQKDAGLTEKGRKKAKAAGHDLKPPQPEGGKRKDSFCARMGGQKKMHNIDCRKTPDKRICQSLKDWNC